MVVVIHSTASACSNLPANHAIPVFITGIVDEQSITQHYLTAVVPIMDAIQTVHQELLNLHGIGLQLQPIQHITPDDCVPPDEVIEDETPGGIFLRIHHDTLECSGDVATIIEDYTAVMTVITSMATPLDEQHLLSSIVSALHLDRNDSEHCARLAEVLVPIEEIAYNGIVEGTEECDSVYPLTLLPCADQQLLPTWTRLNRCPTQGGCGLFPPIPECSFDGVRYDLEVCLALIGINSLPYPDDALIYNDQCLDLTRCSPDSFEWGVELPIHEDDPEHSPTKFYPVRSVSNHTQYRCHPQGDLSRETRCFPLTEEEGTLQRPDAVSSCIISFNSWRDTIPVDDEHCEWRGAFTHLPCDYDRVRASFPNVLPSCFFSLCTWYNANGDYDTSEEALNDVDKYKSCLNAPDYGFLPTSEVKCDENGLEQPRKSFCVLLNQKQPDGDHVELADTPEKCHDRNTIILTKKTDCKYDWFCVPSGPSGGAVSPSACQTCDKVNCATLTIEQTGRICFGHRNLRPRVQIPLQYEEELCDNINNSAYSPSPIPPKTGYVCPKDSCTYEADCKLQEPHFSPTGKCSREFYLQLRKPDSTVACNPSAEGASCGVGVYDTTEYTVQCTAKNAYGDLYYLDPSYCEPEVDPATQSVLLPCYAPCSDNDWQCSIEIDDSSPLGGDHFVTDNIPCHDASIRQHLQSFQSCGTRVFSVRLKCPAGKNCDNTPRPELFPEGVDVKQYTHHYDQVCGVSCLDLGAFIAEYGNSPRPGDPVPPHLLFNCKKWEWKNAHCQPDAPCLYGLQQKAEVCLDTKLNAFVGLLGDVDHLSPCKASAVDIEPITRNYCMTIDDTCDVRSMCLLSATEFGIPQQETFPPVEPTTSDEELIATFHKYEQYSFDHDCNDVYETYPLYREYHRSQSCSTVSAAKYCFVRIPTGAKIPDIMQQDYPTRILHDNWQLFAFQYQGDCHELQPQQYYFSLQKDIFYLLWGSHGHVLSSRVYDTVMDLCMEWRCAPSPLSPMSSTMGEAVMQQQQQQQREGRGLTPISSSSLPHHHSMFSSSSSQPPHHSTLLSPFKTDVSTLDPHACYPHSIPCPHGCGLWQQFTQPLCTLVTVYDLQAQQEHEEKLAPDEVCKSRPKPNPIVECLMTSQCTLFETFCRLKGTSQVLSRENCSSRCDMSLCGKHELEIVCKGYTDHQLDPATAIDAPLEHCADELKQLGLLDGLVCENYLGCTTWGCSDFYSTIDDDHDGDATQTNPPADNDNDNEDGDDDDGNSKYITSKYTISPDLCSYLTPQQPLSRACSSTCGHGTMERKVVCMENGRILRDHDVNSSRCGLYYARPFHRLPCHVPETQCRAEAQCAVGGGVYSTTMCRWLQTSRDCMPMCELNEHEDGLQFNDNNTVQHEDHHHHNNDNLLPISSQRSDNVIPDLMADVATHDETVDVLRRCVYRDTSNRHASSSSCYLQSTPSTVSCETTQDACCWNPLLLAESTPSKNTTPRPEFCPPQSPISGVTTFTQLLVGPNSNLCGSSSAPIPPSPGTPLIIHLDTETPLCWVFAGVPGSTVSLYLAHPALHYLTFIDSYPALSGMNSFVRPTFTLDSRQIAAFLNPSQRDDITTLDKRHFASLIAVVNSQLYTVLDYIVLESSPWQPTPSRNDDATMTGSLALMCGDHPCFNGVCVDGQCQCYGGFSGPSCSHFPLCEDTPDLQCEHGGAPIPTTFRPSSYMFDEGVIASLHTMEEQDRALDNAELPPTAIAPCNRCQCIHHYSGTTCDQCDLQCSKFGKVADDCSQCVCQPGYYGEQCNCRHTYLPVHYHRAPRFLEHYFTNVKTVSLNTSAFTQWKNTLLHELAMDLQLPRSDLDIDRYGYNRAGKSTTFVVVFTIKSCLPFDLSRPDEAVVPPATYRVGNVTDLVMVTQLLADYTTVYRTPEYNSTPMFFDYVAVMPEYQSQMVRGNEDEDGDTIVLSQPSPSSSSSLLSLFESLLIPSQSSSSHITPAVASASPHHTAQTATTRPTQQPTTTQALFSPSAPLLLQSTYFTPSSTATGVGQSMNGGFVSAHPLIDEDCPSMDPSDPTTPATCYTGATRRPTLDHVPYSKASHTSMSLALILIIVFCVIVPVLIIIILLLILWRKQLLCFSDKSEKQDDIDMNDMTLQEGSTMRSQTSNRSTTRQSRRGGGKSAPGDTSVTSRRSNRSTRRNDRDTPSTLSEMVELEDPDLHPEWKKYMGPQGPQGEPIYVNNNTMQSSRIRPDADGTVRKKSLFHRPTIFGAGSNSQQTAAAAATTAPSPASTTTATSPPTIHEE